MDAVASIHPEDPKARNLALDGWLLKYLRNPLGSNCLNVALFLSDCLRKSFAFKLPFGLFNSPAFEQLEADTWAVKMGRLATRGERGL